MNVDRRGALSALAGGLALAIAPSRAAVARPIEPQLPDVLIQGGWMRGRAVPGRVLLDSMPVTMAPDGLFFIAFDRDAPQQMMLRHEPPQGAAFELPLQIAPRAWDIQHVNVAKRPPGMPDAEFAARRAGELARIKAARAVDSGAQGWRQAMVRPATGRISGKFGSQRIYRGEPGAYHAGMDIAGGAGTPFAAPAEGTVVLAAQDAFTLEGHLLIIDHGMGLNSAFLHASELVVTEGDRVAQGQMVGRIGMTGRATGPHLHWALMWRGSRVDPALFLMGTA
ncbi:MAG: hypothetical protein RIS94_1904 [Pseudomonadota bacterium]